jgi:hypothetical protein
MSFVGSPSDVAQSIKFIYIYLVSFLHPDWSFYLIIGDETSSAALLPNPWMKAWNHFLAVLLKVVEGHFDYIEGNLLTLCDT